MINVRMQTKAAPSLAPKIAVVGVGGAGGNAVNNMISSSLEGCEFIVCNTDAQALGHSLCPTRVQLGTHVTGGLGAGTKPEIGRAAAEESLEEVLKLIEGANMAFITAGMGGGTGTGAAPVIARACREMGVLTVGVVTKPFHFEGTHRMRMAEAGIKEMQDYADTLIVIPNQNLFRVANEKVGFADAFKMVDGVLQSGVRGVTDLMVRPGLINLDFADIRTAMLEMGKAMMGTGESSGDKRAVKAAESAINNPLLDDVSMKGARGVIINVTGGYDMTLFEVDEACNRIRDEVDPDANIIFGATFDENAEGSMRVSIVATGIEREAEAQRRSGGGVQRTDARARGPIERVRAPAVEIPHEISAAAAVARAQTLTQVAHSAAPVATNPGAQSPVVQPPLTRIAVPAASAETQAAAEPETDLFDQNAYTIETDPAALPQNTALRGARYKNAFIPPRPVDTAAARRDESDEDFGAGGMGGFGAPPARGQYAAAPSSGSVHASSHGNLSAPRRPYVGSGGGLQLNPPRVPNPAEEQRRRTPSLFERITGSVQSHIDGLTGREVAGETDVAAVTGPAQGSLNIDGPAVRPRATGADDDLDIPAFLRRQAN